MSKLAEAPLTRLLIALTTVIVLLTAGFARAQDAPGGAPPAKTLPTELHGAIVAVGAAGSVGHNFNELTFTPEGGSGSLSLPVARPGDQARLHDAARGDVVWLTVDDAVRPAHVLQIAKVSRPVSIGSRFLALGVSAAVLLALAAIAARGWPQKFLIGVDGRYSNSQLQLALWFGVVAMVYGAATALRISQFGFGYVGGVNITGNVLALTGLSALSFGGAKIVASQKQSSAVAAAAARAAMPARAAAALEPLPALKTVAPKPSFRDLVTNDHGEADLGDFEMLLLTLAAVGIFLMATFHSLGELELSTAMTLPDVDNTLLGAFGLGQGAYLIKKAALPVGKG